MNKVTTLYGDTSISDVPAWGNAMEILKEMGIEVDRPYVHRIYGKDWFTGRPKDNGYVHVYFNDKQGREVAYYTPCMNHILVLKTPIPVPETWMANAEYP
jgi:hypothetical protein